LPLDHLSAQAWGFMQRTPKIFSRRLAWPSLRLNCQPEAVFTPSLDDGEIFIGVGFSH
jgi:hypothetical protein